MAYIETIKKDGKNIFVGVIEFVDTVVHSIRHSFASLLVINGTPIYEVMKLMNHSSIDMTMRYAKLAPDSGQNAVNGMF